MTTKIAGNKQPRKALFRIIAVEEKRAELSLNLTPMGR